jgi:hypothetical protein
MVVMGWDVSTSRVGITCFVDGKFSWADWVDLTKAEGVYEKARLVRERISNIEFLRPESVVHYVEDRLANFSAGKSMLQTLMLLGAFNVLVSWLIMDELGGRVVHIHPSRVKSAMRGEGLTIPKGGDKKALTLDFVRSREPGCVVLHEATRTGKPKPQCYDVADAYITAVAGMRLDGREQDPGDAEGAAGDRG